jgi:O-acetyl-ADP-ribose deacetylase (regulator of RNase III)
MPIIFISLNNTFIEKIKQQGFEAFQMKIEEFQPKPLRRTYWVSPANSLCFMDGGIDLVLSRIIFPNIEGHVKKVVKQIGIQSLLGRFYLPIGSSVIIDENEYKSLIVAPTMLLPQNVSDTQNAYYATMAVLYNILINRGEDMKDIDILFTSMCCGYGKMSEDDSIQQIINGIHDFVEYKSTIINKNIIINEPNLHEQPKYYQNTEFFEIISTEIRNC